MPPNDRIRLRHMLDAAREAVEMGKGQTGTSLAFQRMLSLALTRSIEIVGEAASKVAPETRALCPAIPWPDIVAMRNRLIHA
jgi:uncharacterized protein with HEPN domain